MPSLLQLAEQAAGGLREDHSVRHAATDTPVPCGLFDMTCIRGADGRWVLFPAKPKLPKLLTSATRALRSVDQRKQCPCSFLPKHASPLQPTLATHQGATQVGLRAVRLRGPALRGPALQAGGTHRRVSALHEVQEERRAVGLWNGAGSAGTSRVGQRAGAQEAPPGRRPVWAVVGCQAAG